MSIKKKPNVKSDVLPKQLILYYRDIIDKECGIDNPKDRIKIIGWGSEFFLNPIKKSYPGISDFLTALRTLNKNWVTPKEKKDNRW